MFAILTELVVVYTLWRPSFRRIGVVLGFGLHASIALLMATTLQLTVFGIVMVSSYGFFLADPLPRSVLRSVKSGDAGGSDETTTIETRRHAA